MPIVPAVKGVIIISSILITASIAISENEQIRDWFEETGRRISSKWDDFINAEHANQRRERERAQMYGLRRTQDAQATDELATARQGRRWDEGERREARRTLYEGAGAIVRGEQERVVRVSDVDLVRGKMEVGLRRRVGRSAEGLQDLLGDISNGNTSTSETLFDRSGGVNVEVDSQAQDGNLNPTAEGIQHLSTNASTGTIMDLDPFADPEIADPSELELTDSFVSGFSDQPSPTPLHASVASFEDLLFPQSSSTVPTSANGIAVSSFQHSSSPLSFSAAAMAETSSNMIPSTTKSTVLTIDAKPPSPSFNLEPLSPSRIQNISTSTSAENPNPTSPSSQIFIHTPLSASPSSPLIFTPTEEEGRQVDEEERHFEEDEDNFDVVQTPTESMSAFSMDGEGVSVRSGGSAWSDVGEGSEFGGGR